MPIGPLPPLEVDPTKLVPNLTATQRVVQDNGRASTPFLDLVGSWRNWFSRNVVDLQTKAETVRAATDANEAAITTETNARVSADNAIASQITTINANVASNTAAISSEATARASADSALAGSISTLNTTVAGNTASISTLTGSVNGLEVRYGVQGTINGVTGGFIFGGILRNDGSVAYNLEINSNVTINGNLLVNGTVTTTALGAGAVSDYSVTTTANITCASGATTSSGLVPGGNSTLTIVCTETVSLLLNCRILQSNAGSPTTKTISAVMHYDASSGFAPETLLTTSGVSGTAFESLKQRRVPAGTHILQLEYSYANAGAGDLKLTTGQLECTIIKR